MMEHGEIQRRTKSPFSGEHNHRSQIAKAAETSLEKSISSPDVEPIENMSLSSSMDTPMANGPGSQAIVALANSGSGQQPKVQTAFIHKLYK